MSDSKEAFRHPPSTAASWEELRDALRQGDAQRVRLLISAGADVRYKREHGYDALLDACHGRDVFSDPRLLETLSMLAAHGADLSGVSDYGESSLRVLLHIGRFDAVRLLLDLGADESLLKWTPLIKAVALGSLADVKEALAQDPQLEARDSYSRTAWLIALHSGDVEKAKLLRENGAETNACGRCGAPPLFYAIHSRRIEMLRWLLEEKADVHRANEFGETALIEAVKYDDAECVDALLGAGADPNVDSSETALSRASSRPVIMRLLEADANPAELPHEGQRILLGLPPIGRESLDVAPLDELRRSARRSFGKANPQRMAVPFWETMIRSGLSAFEARVRLEEAGDTLAEPVWCAHRFGQSLTLLADGRAVQIGGEHEDYYDPDFCIYNDVFVHDRDGQIAIYGYPEAAFPPTDFHTATLLDDFIYVIGSLGYQGTRRYGETPVYRLNVRTMKMDRLDTGGDAPGWIYKHRAAPASPTEIKVWSGTIVTSSGATELHEINFGAFVLDLNSLRWRREPTHEADRGRPPILA